MRRRTIRHILRKMSGLGRRATNNDSGERSDRLAKIGFSYVQQLLRARPRLERQVGAASAASPR